MEKIRCITWKQDNGEPMEVWRLSDIDSGMQFFNMLHQCAELEDEIKIVDMTPEEWNEAVKLGEEMA